MCHYFINLYDKHFSTFIPHYHPLKRIAPKENLIQLNLMREVKSQWLSFCHGLSFGGPQTIEISRVFSSPPPGTNFHHFRSNIAPTDNLCSKRGFVPNSCAFAHLNFFILYPLKESWDLNTQRFLLYAILAYTYEENTINQLRFSKCLHTQSYNSLKSLSSCKCPNWCFITQHCPLCHQGPW